MSYLGSVKTNVAGQAATLKSGEIGESRDSEPRYSYQEQKLLET